VKDEELQDAYQAGEAAGENYLGPGIHSSALMCPYDGRTKLGRAWWKGFMAGDRRRCERSKR
jgi:hypothetical protein